MNKIFNYAMLVLLLIIISAIIIGSLKRCNRITEKPKISLIDSMVIVKETATKIWNAERAELIKALNIVSSNSKVINQHYHFTYDSIMYKAPDNCKPVLEILYAASEKRDSSRVREINKQDSIIKGDTKAISDYGDLLLMKDYLLKITRDSLVDVKFDLKKQKKKTRNAKIWGWTKTAAAATISIFTTSKIK